MLAAGVGLSLARRSVGLVDRAAVTSALAPVGGDDWDARVYAISPGSVAFLRLARSVAVAALRPHRPDRGDARHRRCGRSPAFLGVRARRSVRSRGSSRSARSAAPWSALVREAGVTVHAPCALDTLTSTPDGRVARAERMRTRSRRRLVVGADGLRSLTAVREAAGIVAAAKHYGQTAVVANFDCERAHLGRAFQWFLADGGILAWLPCPERRMSMVWSAPRRAGARATRPARRRRSPRASRRAAGTRSARSVDHARAGFPLRWKTPAADCRAPSGAGRRCRARHPSAGRAGREPRLRRRRGARGVLRDRGPVTDPASPDAAGAIRAATRRRRCFASQTVTDGLARLFGRRLAVVRTARNLGMTAVGGLPRGGRFLAHSALR